jgi:hypothetical protein
MVKVKYLDTGLVDDSMYSLDNILPYVDLVGEIAKLPLRGLKCFLYKPKVSKSDSLLETPDQSHSNHEYETKFGVDTRFTFKDITVNQVSVLVYQFT